MILDYKDLFILFYEDEGGGGGKQGLIDNYYLIMLIEFCHRDWEKWLQRMNMRVEKEKGKYTGR